MFLGIYLETPDYGWDSCGVFTFLILSPETPGPSRIFPKVTSLGSIGPLGIDGLLGSLEPPTELPDELPELEEEVVVVVVVVEVVVEVEVVAGETPPVTFFINVFRFSGSGSWAIFFISS